MRNFLTGVTTLLGLVAVSALGTTLDAGTATATDYGKITITHTVECGEMTLTIENTTRWKFSGDWKRPDDVGTPDQYSDVVVKEGPLVGQPFGNRFNAIPIPADATTSFVIELDEDEATESVAYRVARGPEQRLLADWVIVEVETDCQEETTTTTTTTTDATATSTTTNETTTTTSSPPPTSDVDESTTTTTPTSRVVTPRFNNCAEVRAAGQAPILVGTPGFHPDLDADGDGIGCEREEAISEASYDDRDLASTGTSGVAPLVAVGTLALIGGVVVTTVAVRRRRSSGTT